MKVKGRDKKRGKRKGVGKRKDEIGGEGKGQRKRKGIMTLIMIILTIIGKLMMVIVIRRMAMMINK